MEPNLLSCSHSVPTKSVEGIGSVPLVGDLNQMSPAATCAPAD
jgi:hypothetical protein